MKPQSHPVILGLAAFLSLLIIPSSVQSKAPIYKVKCSPDRMNVDVVYTDDVKHVYLEHLKTFPEAKCKPTISGNKATFSINLSNIYECMVTKVVDQASERRVYYHRVIMEYFDQPKQVFLVKCDSTIRDSYVPVDVEDQEVIVVKRAANPQFPSNFEEPDYEIEITSEVTGRAPVPELNVGVKQNGALIDGELTVKPGTPLHMEISLDNDSAGIYGVMVSEMQVTDTRSQEEILILNGCSVDPYLFENFLTDQGDLLKAKFKAFKFPETNYVLFKGTVNVCLDKCQGIECANGQIGYGRRRRRRRDIDGNERKSKIYEVSMSTIVKVSEEHLDGKGTTIFEEDTILDVYRHTDDSAISALSEEHEASKYVNFEQRNGGMSRLPYPHLLITTFIIALFHYHL